MSCLLCGEPAQRLHLTLSTDIRIVRCRRCRALYRSPRPDPDALARDYDERYFRQDYETHADGGGRDYLSDRERLMQSFDAHLADLERLCRPGRLLDVGCAAGFLLAAARRRGWEVVGLEFSAFAADYARREFSLEVQQAPVDRASFPHGSFDAITAFEFIEHVPTPGAALNRMRDWLRPGGVLALTTPNAASWQARRHPDRFGAFLESRHLVYFTPVTLSRLLRHAGFRIRQLRTDVSLVSTQQLLQAGMPRERTQQLRTFVNRTCPGLIARVRRMLGKVVQGGSIKVYAEPVS